MRFCVYAVGSNSNRCLFFAQDRSVDRRVTKIGRCSRDLVEIGAKGSEGSLEGSGSSRLRYTETVVVERLVAIEQEICSCGVKNIMSINEGLESGRFGFIIVHGGSSG